MLERHFNAAGFTHTFGRPSGWEWDVGVHYVVGMRGGIFIANFVTSPLAAAIAGSIG